MSPEELARLSDDELLEVFRKNKPSPLIDAFFIGFLIGIIIYIVAANGWGFFALIPLFLVYILLKKPKQYQMIRHELEERKLL